jgi:hypothetical protein
MKKLFFLFTTLLFITIIGCGKKAEEVKPSESNPTEPKIGATSFLTNVHAPTSGSDSIVFTADSSYIGILLFSPLGGSNHVIIRDLSLNIDVFNSNVTNNDTTFSEFIPGNNYSIKCLSGTGGSQTGFTHVASSYRNSGQTPNPFAGYTQYFNNSAAQGPSDGVVVIVREQPPTGTGHK